VNSFSQLAARSVLKFRNLFQDRIVIIMNDRIKLDQNLREIPGVSVYPTVANFLFFSTVAPASEVYRYLLEEGVMVRFIGVPGRGDYLRVSVGTESENTFFIDKLKSVLMSKF